MISSAFLRKLKRRVRRERLRTSCRRELRFEQLEDRRMLNGTPPTFAKDFLQDTIGPGSVSTLTFTIDNTADPGAAEDLAFLDNLPAGVTIASVPNITFNNIVDPIFTAPAGGSTISLTDGAIVAGQIGTISVDVTAGAIDSADTDYVNTTGDLTSTLGNSGTAADTLTVDIDLPGFTMAFADATIALGERTTLTYTIDNFLNPFDVFNLDFVNNLPDGLVIAGPSNGSLSSEFDDNLFPPVLTATPGSNVITFDADGTSLGDGFPALEAGEVVTISVDVIATGVGLLGNTTGDLLVDLATDAGKASASINVIRNDLHMVTSFTDDPASPGGTVNAEFTITNFDRFDPATGITFDLDLDAGLTGLAPSGALPTDPLGAGSILSFADGVLTLTGGTLPIEGSETFNVTLAVPPATPPGEFTFPVSTVSGTVGGSPVSSDFVVDSLFVTLAPELEATFLTNPIGTGGTTTLQFTVTNTSATLSASDIAFTGNLSQFINGVAVSSPSSSGFAIGPTISVIDVSGEDVLSVSGGELAPSAVGTISVDLTIPLNAPIGDSTFTTSDITATVDGETATGLGASADLTVVGAPDLQMLFTDDPVLPGDTATLEFTISHDEFAPTDATDIMFTVDLNAVIAGLESISPAQNNVVGAGSTFSGTQVLTLTNGTLSPGQSETFSVIVQVPEGTTPGSFPVTSSNIDATVDGVPAISDSASDNLDIVVLTLEHSFTDPVVAGQSTTLTYTLTNLSPDPPGPNNGEVTAISFTHELDDIISGLTSSSATQNDIAGIGSQLEIVGGNSIQFTGGNLAANTFAEFSITVDVPAAADSGTFLSQTSNVSHSFDGNTISGDPSVSNLEVVDAVTILKTFIPDTVAAGDTAVIEYTLTNNLPTQSLSSVTFTDDLNAFITGLEAIDTPVNQDGFMVTGTSVLTAIGSLAPNDSATFQVTVLIPETAAAGTFVSDAFDVSGNVDDVEMTAFSVSGGDATLTVTVDPDFGDAPISYGTRLTDDGARHLPGGPRLGAFRDFEPDVQPPLNGLGDDLDGAIDDEDAVASLVPVLLTDTSYSVNLTLSNTSGGDANLVGWIDFDVNGVFDPDEAATAIVPHGATMATLTWNNLGTSGPDVVAGASFGRFRLSTDELTPSDTTGEASDGEVEDHALLIGDFVVTNTNDSGAGSLRRAIEITNAFPGVDTITFNIPGPGTHTIRPLSALPTITEGVIIDGTSEPDFAGTPVIEIDGSLAGAGVDGLKINSGGSTVRALVINRFAGSGILLNGNTGNVLEGNFIGTSATGTSDLGNGKHGVLVNGSSSNTIGGTTAAARNLISGNDLHGILIAGAGAANNAVQGNFIGSDSAGTAALGNSTGVRISSASSNTIGGMAVGAGNVIAGNVHHGVFISTASGNVVRGNLIGVDQSGTSDLGNLDHGVFLSAAGSNTIGGTTMGQGNVISGNNEHGIFITGGGSTNNLVQGNRIGVDQSGTADLGNTRHGVSIFGAGSNTIGGAAAGARNVISGNDQHGVLISGLGSTNNSVQGNLIGTDSAGTTAVGNSTGVRISSASSNTIGGTAAGAGNVIAGNVHHGVFISTTTGNVVRGNLIGVDQSGTSDLGNLDHGVFLSAAGSNTIGGTTMGQGNVISGNNEHGIFITGGGSTNNLVQGNQIGVDQGATSDLGNTRHGVSIFGAGSNTIGGAAAGAGNVISGNNQHGVLISGLGATNNTVQGNLIGTDGTGTTAVGNASGVRISSSAANTVGGTAAGAGNVISGNSVFGVYISGAPATGNLVQGNSIGVNQAGSGDLGNTRHGVFISDAGSNTVGGVAADAGNVISGNNQHGVLISGAGSTNNIVRGNLIGTDSTGTSDIGNTLSGVRIVDASSNTVGGTAADAGNVIAFNVGDGVFVSGSSVNNAIQRNSTFSNADLGIDLGTNGVTANDTTAANEDSDTGANNLQNFPEITLAELDGTNLTIDYAVPSAIIHSAYDLTIEFFLADGANQEGQTFLGSDNYPAASATLSDQVILDVTGLGVSVTDQIVATATDANGSTSEFSVSFVVTAPLLAAGGEQRSQEPEALRSDQLQPIVAAALSRLGATGASAADLATLSSVTFAIADLPGARLGLASGNTITLDTNAAGYGWFIDSTPLDDSEFLSGSGLSTLDSQLHTDLLTAVMHEMEHVLGHGHSDVAGHLLNRELPTGVRRLPTADDLDALFGNPDLLQEILA